MLLYANQQDVSFPKTKKEFLNTSKILTLSKGVPLLFANLKIYVCLQYERIQSQGVEWLVNLIL